MNALVRLGLAWLSLQDPGLQQHRNLGKAYYEQGEFALAVGELGAVLDSEEASARDYVNAGLAYLQNRDDERALAAFTTAGQMDPSMAAVDFGLGVLYKRQLRYPLALEAFQRVVARAPEDPCTWFNIGAVLAAMGRTEPAEEAFARVAAMGYPRAKNFYVSALFRRANILARRGEGEQAEALFAEFRELRDRTPNVSLTPAALENGRYGQVEIDIPSVGRSPEPLARVELSDSGELRVASEGCEEGMSLALGDYDRDGLPDVFVSSPCGSGRLFRNEGDGRFVDTTEGAGLAAARDFRGAVFVDYDDSGFVSLFAWGEGGNRLFRNRGGQFEDVTQGSGVSPAGRAAAFFDADNDGWLDLVLARWSGGVELFRGDGEGAFRSTWRENGIDVRGLAVADVDENGFPDVVAVTRGGEARLYANDGAFLRSEIVEEGLGVSEYAFLHVVDSNHDGWLDVTVRGTSEATVLVNRFGRLERWHALGGWLSLVPADLDGDGYASFIGRNARGARALVSYRGGEKFEARPIEIPGDAASLLAVADLDGNGGADVLAATEEGRIRVFRRHSPSEPAWVRLALTGTRTNRGAVGAVVEAKAGRFYQKHLYQGRPLTLFAGGREELDVVRVTWANGVIQNETAVKTNQRLEIEEAEKQTSSCPFLYVWDGERFRFLTDVVGRAPLGEILPNGGTVVPNPEDYVRIPPGAMEEREGKFVFQITEELRELAALDALELLVVESPHTTEIYTNERFSTPPFEPFRLYAVGEAWPPEEASDARGNDVLSEVLASDGRYVAGFLRDSVPGFAEEHALVLTPPAAAEGEPLWLFLSGWVYWPSSSSMRALETSNGLRLLPPSLEVLDASGEWTTVIEEVGLPSGMGRTLVVDLAGKFLSRDRRVRMVTNFAVYWDEAFFGAPASREEPARVHRLAPATADLHYRGFSRVTLGDRAAPERYDYDRLLADAPWDAVPGPYTRFGDVSSLVAARDGGLVVMAPGDEMTVSFDAGALAPLAEGWTRTFVLHVTGWAKDQDPNTLFSKTVGPLPQRDRELQTRRVPPQVVPLRPPSSSTGRVRQ